MKKRIIWLSLIVVLLLSACSPAVVNTEPVGDDAPKNESIHEKQIDFSELDQATNDISSKKEYLTFTGSMSENSYIQDLKTLEDMSCAIVSGKVTRKREVMFDNGDFPMTGITISSLKVNHVLKTDGKIEEGTEVNFVEYYWTEQNGNSEQIITYDYYKPTNINGEYLMFFTSISSDDYDDPAKYTPTVLWMGKYPINENLSDSYKDGSITSSEATEYSEINGAPENYVAILNELMKSKKYSAIIDSNK